MKNCEYYEELIGAALDGEITAEEDKELRAHLESCEACRSFYEAMQAISGTDDALGDVPENFTANVMARVHETAAPAEKPAIFYSKPLFKILKHHIKCLNSTLCCIPYIRIFKINNMIILICRS